MEFSPILSKGFFDGALHECDSKYVAKFMSKDQAQAVDAVFELKKSSNKLLVVLPSALSKDSISARPVFHRWSWSEFFDCNFLCLSDPSFDIPGLLGGWFIADGKRDVINDYKDIVSGFCERLGVEEKNVVFYGSSMGGFGALMLSSFFPDALCVAEVPQLDLRSYPWRSAINAIEESCLSGESLQDFYLRFPERVCVLDRFKKNKTFPNIELISNSQDNEASGISGLYDEYLSCQGDFKKFGSLGITITNKVSGHKPLPTAVAVRMLKFMMRKYEIFR